MSETRGIFSLEDVVDQKAEGDYVSLDNVWHSPSPPGPSPSPNTGYFGGGYQASSPTLLVTMDKTDFTNDTTAAVPGANLTIARSYMGATGNSTHGYFAGGFPGENVIDKVAYATDTTVALPSSGNLSGNRRGLTGTGNETAGYFGGGAPGPLATMDKTTYSTDTTAAVPGANLSAARSYLAATGNSTHGYFGGGEPGPKSIMDKLTYSTDTTAAVPGANLNSARYALGATGNSTHGYFGGGANPVTATMEKTTYSSDTTAAVPGANLSGIRNRLSAAGNADAGYFGGGWEYPGDSSIIDKVTYTSDTTARVPGANLTVARRGPGASSSKSNALPGTAPIPTTSTPSRGYFGGGRDSSSTALSIVDKITYSTDTTARIPGADLPDIAFQQGAVGNFENGYFSGGYQPSVPGIQSTVYKLTYSTDTSTTLPTAGALSAARRYHAGVGSLNAGYFVGGYESSPVSNTDKLTFSSDTTAAVPGAKSTENRFGAAGAGNSDAGYIAGGNPAPVPPTSGRWSFVDKLTYSSDTTALVPGANLVRETYAFAATGNSFFGYFGGGAGAVRSEMNKMTYSNDTMAAVPSAFLATGRRFLGATGDSNAGYFAGGENPSVVATTEKITYSTDTIATVASAALGAARKDHSGVKDFTSVAASPNII